MERSAANAGSFEAGGMLSVPIGDSAARMLLVTHFVAWLDGGCQARVSDLVRVGLTPDLIDRLRSLSVADAMRLAARPCSMTLCVDCTEIRDQLDRIERQRDERTQFERFIGAGASPTLIGRLFAVSTAEVRRRRKLIAPHAAMGGRPRLPDEKERLEIQSAWLRLRENVDRSERSCWLQLADLYPHLAIVSLEDVVERLQGDRLHRASHTSAPTTAQAANRQRGLSRA